LLLPKNHWQHGQQKQPAASRFNFLPGADVQHRYNFDAAVAGTSSPPFSHINYCTFYRPEPSQSVAKITDRPRQIHSQSFEASFRLDRNRANPFIVKFSSTKTTVVSDPLNSNQYPGFQFPAG
jgi:hypothetical protein